MGFFCLGCVFQTEFLRSLLERLSKSCVGAESQDFVGQPAAIAAAKEARMAISQQTEISWRIGGQDGDFSHQRLTDDVGSPLLA